MHAKACAGTENVEWSGQILMGLLSHAKQVLGTLKWSARVGWGFRMRVGWLTKVERLSD